MLGGNCLSARMLMVPMGVSFLPISMRFAIKEVQSRLRHDLGKTSIVEGLNTKSSNCEHLLRRQRQSGLVRKSCGVCWRILDDI